jgi:hypothetical protein
LKRRFYPVKRRFYPVKRRFSFSGVFSPEAAKRGKIPKIDYLQGM